MKTKILNMVKILRVFKNRPKVGDKVKVAVGFSTFLNEGTVSSVHDDYCWIDQFYPNGKYKKSFTASFSYCKFYFI